MENNEGALKQIIIGVLIAVLSAFVIWKLGFNQSDSPKIGEDKITHPIETKPIENTKTDYEVNRSYTKQDIEPSVTKSINSTTVDNENTAEVEVSPSWKLVGLWQTDVVELNMQIRIIWNIRSNGTSTYTFITPNVKSTTNGTWKFSKGYTLEQFEDGGFGKGRVIWKNNDTFELTIIDNGVPAYSGLKRVYVRL